jgi:DNA-binding NtrC family response regulator/pSer/pThr/pTyr-binding forkhead associated (FHA) protein
MLPPLPRLVVVEGPWSGVEISLPTAAQVLGRDPSCELAVPDSALSRRHLRLVPHDGGWELEDLGSSNGTTVNGERVDRIRLEDGDVVAAGRCVFRFSISDQTALVAAGIEGTTIVTAAPDHWRDDPSQIRDDVGRLAQLADGLIEVSQVTEIGLRFAQWVRERLDASEVFMLRRRRGRLIPVGGLPVLQSPLPRTSGGLLSPDAAVLVSTEGKTICVESDGGLLVAVPIGAPAELVVVARGIPAAPSEDQVRLLACAGQVAAGILLSRIRERGEAAVIGAAEERGGVPFVAESPAMRGVLEFVERAAPSDATVLVLGESGTGKEMIARALHDASRRSSAPFVAINCAAIAETLLESELFGHERGAFTGATSRRAGRFEQAHGGTLLLDEVGELSPHAQAGLLRVLEEACVHRIGGADPIPVDVRVIAATHRDLQTDVAACRFREDLYFRLAVLVVDVPPLRDRPEDVAALARVFFNRFCARAGRAVEDISASAMEALLRHSWPGNVRQLRNAIERAVILGRSRVIERADLPPEVAEATSSTTTLAGGVALPMSAAELERANIGAALQASDGNKSEAARLLGIDRNTLYSRLRSYAENDDESSDGPE